MLRETSSIFLVFLGCCANVLVLEKLTNNINGIANLITLLQFIFVALEGFIFTSKFGTKKPLIPPKKCFILIILFFLSSVCNNYAYNFNVPTTLHIIIKSGSLVTNMAVGVLIGKRQYNIEKYIGVIFVTLGITICTLSSAKILTNSSLEFSFDFVWWSIGIFLLIFALIVGAIMGLVQENIYATHGRHPHDVMYYTHLLPLPLFVFLFNDLKAAVEICLKNETLNIPVIDLNLSVWVLLFLNVSTQYICIRSVYILTSECTALTVNLVITLRKFVSLLLSVVIFENIFYTSHWIGTICVFSGTMLYLDMIPFQFSLSKLTKPIL